MTARENLLSLYRLSGYKHAPVHINMCPSLQEHFRALSGGRTLAEYFDYPEGFAQEWLPGLKQVAREPVDWTQYYDVQFKPGTHFDEYGVAHEPGSAAAKHMTRMHHPLARMDSLEQLPQYPYPEYDAESIPQMKTVADAVHARGLAAAGGMACTIWERSWYLRDMTRLMMDMMEEDEKAVFLLDKITDLSMQRAAAFAAAGADIIELGDDVGMQQAIMMSREMYCEWLKPRLAKVIAAARSVKPDVLIFYHSCGFVEPLINDLIDAGVDILNPVQPECMDFAEIHAKYGDRLSFNGTLGTQQVMPFGTPEDVSRTVRRNLEIAGAKGGLLCCPTHMLEPEVPWENIVAYVETCKEMSR